MSIPQDQRTADFVMRLTLDEQRTLRAYSEYRGQTMSELARTFIFRGIGFHYPSKQQEAVEEEAYGV